MFKEKVLMDPEEWDLVLLDFEKHNIDHLISNKLKTMSFLNTKPKLSYPSWNEVEDALKTM